MVSSTRKTTGKSAHGTSSPNKQRGKKKEEGSLSQLPDPDQSRENKIGDSPSLLDAHDSILTVKRLSEIFQVDEPAIRWQIREKRIPAHDYYGKKLSLQSEVMWTIRNSKCNMDMSDMYGKREGDEDDETEESA